MDDVDTIVKAARSRGLTLWVEAQQLRYRGPAGALTPDLRQQLSARKSEIVALLTASEPMGAAVSLGPRFLPRPAPNRLPILEYHLPRWADVRSGQLGIEFVNSPNAAFRLFGTLNVRALRAALKILTRRHSILTARVSDAGCDPQYVFDVSCEIPLRVLEVPGSNRDARAAAAADLASQLIWAPFSLHDEPWLRVFVLTLDAAEYVIGFVAHHFIADGFSVQIIRRELLGAYWSLCAGRAPEFAQTPLQYSDYVIGMNEWIRSDSARLCDDYWRQHMRQAPPTQVPPDHRVEPDATGALATQAAHLNTAAVALLREFSRSRGILMGALMTAALAAGLAHLSGATDIVIVSATSGRNHPGLTGMVGSLFDTVSVRIRVSMSSSFAALVQQVQGTLIRGYPYQRYPRQLVKSFLPQIGASDIAPMLNFIDADARPAGKRTSSRVASFEPSPRPDVCHQARRYTGFYTLVVVDASGLTATAEYLGLLYDSATAARYIQLFCKVLERGAREPERVLSSLLAEASAVAAG
jgi:hypothetical protein